MKSQVERVSCWPPSLWFRNRQSQPGIQFMQEAGLKMFLREVET